jgi:GT2 family glycosyltransferase
MDAPFSWLTGACLAVSKQVWQATGGFDPDYFLYWEDVDYSQRAKAVRLDWWCAMTSS